MGPRSPNSAHRAGELEKWPPKGPKMAPRRPQNRPKIAGDGSQTAPRWPEDRLKIDEDGSRSAQERKCSKNFRKTHTF